MAAVTMATVYAMQFFSPRNAKFYQVPPSHQIWSLWELYFWKTLFQVQCPLKSIFLRNRSLSNARWFYGKKRKIGKGNLYITENRLKSKCAVLQIITVICVTHVQKNFQIQTWIKQLLTKYQFFTKLPQIPHIHMNLNFSSIFATF